MSSGLHIPWILQRALTRVLAAVGPAVPAAINELQLEVSPVLGFAASTGLQVKVAETDLDWGPFIMGNLGRC